MYNILIILKGICLVIVYHIVLKDIKEIEEGQSYSGLDYYKNVERVPNWNFEQVFQNNHKLKLDRSDVKTN